MDAKMGHVSLIACGALAREIGDICALNGLKHIQLSCLPAIYHNHPEKIAPALSLAIKQARTKGVEQIFIGYADCASKGEIDKICQEENVQRLPGPHCYAFFSGTKAFLKHAEDDLTCFYLTDFLARHFKNFVIEPLKLDKHPQLKEMLFHHYERIVYLAQSPNPSLENDARWAADYLGLDFEMRLTGYGELEDALKNIPASRKP